MGGTAEAVNDGMRRRPVQERSRVRLASVKAATIELLAGHRPADITIAMIAERAGVSAAWLYRYYPEKRSVLNELLAESLARLDAALAASGFSLAGADWATQLDRAIDVIVDFVRDDPSFRPLWFSTEVSSEMIASNRDHDAAMARELSGQIATRLSRERESSAYAIALMVMGIIDKGVDLAFAEGDRRGNPAAIRQFKVAARAYLGLYLD